MRPTPFSREHASRCCYIWTRKRTRSDLRRFLWHFMLLGTGSNMPSTRTWHCKFKMPWKSYSTHASHILHHGFGYTMWIGSGFENPSTRSQTTGRVPKEPRCTMQCHVDLLGQPSTSSLCMERMSLLSVVFAELRCTRHR